MPLAPADAPETVARVQEGMPLVRVLALQLSRHIGGYNIDDLMSAGNEGLLNAARTYDASLGVSFRRWVNVRVRGAMLDSVRSQSELPHRIHARLRAIEAGDRISEADAEEQAQKPTPTEVDADARLTSFLEGVATAIAVGLLGESVSGTGARGDVFDPDESAEDRVARMQVMAHVREAIAAQPEAERHLLTRHYFDGVEFKEAAAEIGLSKSWASRIHARAIEGVTRELKKRNVER